MLDLYPGAEQHPAASDGGSYIATATLTNGETVTVPWRLELHTTEGPSIAAARAALDARGYWSHLAFDPRTGECEQYIPLTRAARSSSNLAGGVETNRCRCIQVELIGYAAEARHWPAEDLERIAGLVATLVRECGVPINVARWLPTYDEANYGDLHPASGEYLASTRGKQRLSFDAWVLFDGICGHQHLPENGHWDPGALDLSTISRRARALLIPEVPDMTPEECKAVIRAEVPAIIREEISTALADLKAWFLKKGPRDRAPFRWLLKDTAETSTAKVIDEKLLSPEGQVARKAAD